VLRAALTCAIEEQIIRSNPAAVIRLSSRDEQRRKRRKRYSWTVDEARRFLESARRDSDVLYAAYVLVLVLGRGEVLGLTWDRINLDVAELYVDEQLQRSRHQLVRRQTKTDSSDAPLPLPEMCVTALKLHRQQQDADRERAGKAWIETGLVFTTRHGTRLSRATSTVASTAGSAG
jgi:integrase